MPGISKEDLLSLVKDTVTKAVGEQVSAFKSIFPDQVSGQKDPLESKHGAVYEKKSGWVKLSKGLEDFANMCRTRFDPLSVTKFCNVQEYNAARKEEYKAAGMSEGVDADGGILVPIEYAANVIELAVTMSSILQNVFRLPMSGQLLRIPRLGQSKGSYFGGVQLYSTSEAELMTQSKPSFDSVTFTAKKLTGLVYLTDELIADSAINILNYVTTLFTRAFQYKLENYVLNGNGVDEPLGLAVDPTIQKVPRQVVGTIGYQDVVNMDAAIDEQVSSLTWMTRKATQITLTSLRDSNQRPIFLADYGVFNGQPLNPPTMLSYPVYRTRNVPELGEQGDLILGDLRMYGLAMRQAMTVDTSIHSRFPYGETAVRFVTRQDGAALAPMAFAVLNDANS